MHNDSSAILDDLLSRWHDYCRQVKLTASGKPQPMFRDATRPRGGQTVDALLDDDAEKGQMEGIDRHIRNMDEPYRTAIYIDARNLYTGAQVWESERLKGTSEEVAAIVAEARAILIRRLTAADLMGERKATSRTWLRPKSCPGICLSKGLTA